MISHMAGIGESQKNIGKTDQETATDTKQRSKVDLPSISLPKGGGAIGGIGEKFAANPVTGTGSLEVPIFMTPGRSGFGPQLSLSYDSGSGNGPFGLGWDLSLPSITRKTSKGLPQYRDEDESDTFILSGAEDLVPVLKQDTNGGWQRDSATSTVDSVQYHIRPYRPRIEGLFAKIDRWTNLQTGETHWRSISKDNIITIYGLTANSRITDSTDPTRIFSWLICESQDDKGNAILYHYKEENSQRVDVSFTSEINRAPASRATNRYLKQIKYGNKTPRKTGEKLATRSDWLYEVVFDYGEHYSEDNQVPSIISVSFDDNSREWTLRKDPFSRYRSCFEIRTYRLCQRVLMFHHFPEELGTENYLVRSTDFTYDENLMASFINKITQSGYIRKTDGTYHKKSFPPIELEYSPRTIHEEIKEVDGKSLENLPIGLDGSNYQWVDLDGEGLSGILTEQDGSWFYKRNLSALSITQNGEQSTEAHFGPLEKTSSIPSFPDIRSGKQHFLDLDGDGQLELVHFENSQSGFFERNKDEKWESFIPLSSIPNIPWTDPNLKFIDLTGDGHADVLISEDQAFTWYSSLGEKGFAKAEKVSQALDEEKGPRLIFADPTQSVFLADMSGDGLTDLVRIRNGEVCYWPNLGYGKFAAKVTMDNSPRFDHSDIFDLRRILLADIDGSGVIDIIYIRSDEVNFYFNESGNGWSNQQKLKSFPSVDNLSSVMVVDLLGNGTACLVWSSPLAGNARSPMSYVDLMGGKKPHLLISASNNMGATTEIEYAPSTKFYLQDRFEGKPWITRLPFPVYVVERVKTFDIIGKNLFVTRYAYHHGYFDGIEREFRGFGMVEQWDTEEYATLGAVNSSHSLTNIKESSHIPPVLTKTWFHTGAHLGRDHVSDFFAGLIDVKDRGEYYREPPWRDNDSEFRKHLLDESVLPTELTVEEEREANRALKGSMLRQEVYSVDGTDKDQHPYTITEQNFDIRVLQPRVNNPHAVFFTHNREVINYYYEREYDPADPRVSHDLILEVDNFGNILKRATIGYGRRQPDSSLPLQADRDKQTRLLVTYTENSVTNYIDDVDNYRAPLPCESRTYELAGYTPTGSAGRYQHADFVQPDPNEPRKIIHVFDNEIKYEDSSAKSRQRRLIQHVRTLYRKNDLTDLLSLGQLDFLALQGESYKLAFTPGLLTKVYQRRQNGRPLENLLPNHTTVLGEQAGYIKDSDDLWWIPSGRVFYSRNNGNTAIQELTYAKEHFFLPQRYQDPFGYSSTATFDRYDVLMIETLDPLNNTITAKNDYRVLQPNQMTDPNRNRTEVIFDALGMVVGTAVMGKPPPAPVEGDSLDGFDLEFTEAVILDHLSAPLTTNPHLILGKATTRLIYDLFAYHRTKDQPNPHPIVVYALVRETHNADLGVAANTKIQHSFSYSDGFGREIQRKIQAEPEQVDHGDPSTPTVNPRWVGSGWTIFNNKGKPVRQYEPFFSSTHNFEFAEIVGVSLILFYDPVGRVITTLHPNHTYEKVMFNPWQQTTWDVTDTTKAPDNPNDPPFDPKNDPDVGHYFRRLPDDQYLPTWYELRTDTAKAFKEWPDTDLQDHPIPDNVRRRATEKSAAYKAAAHANTPTITYLDTLGRAFLTTTHNKVSCKEHDLDGTENKFHTRVEMDIKDNQRIVRDAVEQNGDKMGRITMRYDYDMLGNRIHKASMEAGERWMLNDVTGKPICVWDSKGHIFRTEYDPLRRPLRSFVAGADTIHPNQELLTERMVYGEQHPEDELRNMRGRMYHHLDQAGVIRSETYDFKGNLLRGSRSLAKEYKQGVDWHGVDANPVALPTDSTTKLDPTALEAALAPFLESEIFAGRITYDALNRTIQVIPPHSNQAGARLNVIQPVYNEAKLIEQLHIWLDQVSEPTGLIDAATMPPSPVGVDNIDYDAKGQRLRIDYVNGVTQFYEYDPLTFRLVRLLTIRDASTFPTDCIKPPPDGWPGCQVQNLQYTYDPVGNITHIRDDAQQTIYFHNKRVEPSADYTYDAIYRLIEASGREHLGQVGGSAIPHSYNDAIRVGLPHPNDGNAMGTYTERYVYDPMGNFLEMQHHGTDPAHPGWTRSYAYGESSLIDDIGHDTTIKSSNRLSSTTVGSNNPTIERYTYDVHGNMIRMPHLGGTYPAPNMYWDSRDQLRKVELGGGGTAYYVYDANGQRIRKVWEKSQNLVEERLYLGGFEIFRRRNGAGVVKLERETLHIMNDKQRIALVEKRTIDTEGNDHSLPQLIRYQFSNHLGSDSLELDDQAQIISYEEYTPYGSTSYQAVRSQLEAPKQYKYTGKERDDESGLYYHGARYYASWFGRWTACDHVEKVNRYTYVGCSPVRLYDPDGNEESEGSNRFWGGMRMLGGTGQLVLGALALAAPEPTMVTKVVGAIAVVNGADDFMTGWRQMISGHQERGAIETTVTKTAEAAGMGHTNAEALGTGTSMALGFVSPTGPMTSGPRAVPALARLSSGERVLVTTGVEMSRVADHARGAQLAANGFRAAHTMMMSASGGDSDSPSGSQVSSSSSSPGSSPEPNSSQIPDEFFDEAMSRIDQGELQASGAHLDDLTNHAQSSEARAQRGISGQSSHISARSAMRTVAGYNPRAALTRILDVVTHRGFDDYWKSVFRQMARTSGEATISVGDYFNVMRDAIGNNPHFSTQEANSMVELLKDELFVQHGLNKGDLLRLPYSK